LDQTAQRSASRRYGSSFRWADFLLVTNVLRTASVTAFQSKISSHSNSSVSSRLSHPGTLFKPYEKLVKITVMGREVEVPDGNMLLRAFQYLAPEDVALGRFCWNEECQYCRVTYDQGEGTNERIALAC
jgi:hypothetical protein